MSDPEDHRDPNELPRRIEVDEKSIRGSGARLIDQDVPEDFEAPSLSLEADGDDD